MAQAGTSPPKGDGGGLRLSPTPASPVFPRWEEKQSLRDHGHADQFDEGGGVEQIGYSEEGHRRVVLPKDAAIPLPYSS